MKLKKDYIIFDLDGTLLASAPDIISCMQKMQKDIGMKVWEAEDLVFAIGPPLELTLANDFKVAPDKIEETYAIYRSHYAKVQFNRSMLFDGVVEMLEKLKNSGIILAIGTSKLEHVALRCLEELEIAHYFQLIAGHNEEEHRDTKGKVIDYAVKTLGCEKDNVILIGDRKFDIIGAKEVGIESMAVLYGYGNQEEFDEYGADYVVKTTKEIENIFC